MTIADEQAKYLPYYKCIGCGSRVFQMRDLSDEACGCDPGEGHWILQNAHLLLWAQEALA